MRALLTKIAAAGIFAAAALAGPAHSATLNIDFNNANPAYVGVGKAPDGGTVWNAVGPGANEVGGLLYSDGSSATNVLISTTFERQWSNLGGSNNEMLADRLITDDDKGSEARTVTISGLQSGSYNLYAYAGFYSELFTVGSQSKSASGDHYDVGPGAWIDGVQYALLTGLNVGPSGIMTLVVQGLIGSPTDGGSQHTTIAGLQLQQTPIPPALPLFASGLALLHFLRRRKRPNAGASREA